MTTWCAYNPQREREEMQHAHRGLEDGPIFGPFSFTPLPPFITLEWTAIGLSIRRLKWQSFHVRSSKIYWISIWKEGTNKSCVTWRRVGERGRLRLIRLSSLICKPIPLVPFGAFCCCISYFFFNSGILACPMSLNRVRLKASRWRWFKVPTTETNVR